MDYDGIVAGMTPLAKADFEKALEIAGSDEKVVANAAAAATRRATTISDILTEKAAFNAAFASALRMKQIGRLLSVQEKTANGAQVEAALELVAAIQITKAMSTLFGKDSLHSSEMEIEDLGIQLTGNGEWRSGVLEIIVAHAKELSKLGNYETIRDEMLPACTELFGLGASGNVDELTSIRDEASLNEIISLCNKCKAMRNDPVKARELLERAKRIDAENSKNQNLVNPSIQSAEEALGWKGAIVAGLMNWRAVFNKKQKPALTIREVQTPAKQRIETRS